MCNIGYRSIYSVSWRTSNKITFSLPYSACWMFTVLLICYAVCTGFSFGDRTAISHDCKTPSITWQQCIYDDLPLVDGSLAAVVTYIHTYGRTYGTARHYPASPWQAAGNNNYDNLRVLYFLLWMFTLYSTLFQPQSSRTHYILMSVLWYVCFVEATLYIHSVNNNCCQIMYWYYLSIA